MAGATAPLRVLVVDDEVTLRAFMVRALRGDGHEVAFAEDGAGALAQIAGAEHPFDVVISDIVMPETDGIALALKIAKDSPQTAVVLVSGYPAELERARNLDALVRATLAKPFTMDDLCKLVTSLAG
ncbi:MAG: response regulator [Alphaproteobacteria bacterium]